jgi:transcriptional regulator with XRE-family HTH domain
MSADNPTMGDLIKEIRANSSMTQQAFGEQLGTNKRRVAQLERGKAVPSIDEVQSLRKIHDELLASSRKVSERLAETQLGDLADSDEDSNGESGGIGGAEALLLGIVGLLALRVLGGGTGGNNGFQT